MSSSMASAKSSPLWMPGTISTSGIKGAGLKKWSPPKRSGCFSPLDRAAMLKLEVFVHNQAVSLRCCSAFCRSSFLTLRSSMTASTTRSAPSMLLRSSDQFILERVSVFSASLMRPFSTNLPKTFSMEALLRPMAPG